MKTNLPIEFKESHVEAYYHVRYIRNFHRDNWETTHSSLKFAMKAELDYFDEWLSKFEAWMAENQIPNQYELMKPHIKSSILSITVGS